MDNTEAIAVASTAVVVGKKSAVGGSMLFSSMVIFQDPTYIVIGLIGAFVSVGSEYYDLKKLEKDTAISVKKNGLSIPQHLVKAFVIGLLFTIMSFIFLMQVGESLIKHIFGLGVAVKLLPSFWMVGTIYLSTKSIAIYSAMSKKMGW